MDRHDVEALNKLRETVIDLTKRVTRLEVERKVEQDEVLSGPELLEYLDAHPEACGLANLDKLPRYDDSIMFLNSPFGYDTDNIYFDDNKTTDYDDYDDYDDELVTMTKTDYNNMVNTITNLKNEIDDLEQKLGELEDVIGGFV